MLSITDVKRLHLADVTLPKGATLEGEGCPVYGFVVTHPEGIVVIDTGVGGDQPGIEALYRPVRRPLADVLAEIEIATADVALVINSHLHFDHCGENRLFPGRPIFVQAAEYEAAYTTAEYANPEEAHARGLESAWDRQKYLQSLRRLRELGPRRVHFSHDPTVWEAG